MRKPLRLLIGLLIFWVLLASSCGLTSPTIETESYMLSTTQLATSSSPPDPQNVITLSQSTASQSEDFKPQTGSILRWIDLSNFTYFAAGDYELNPTPESALPSTFHLDEFWIQQDRVTRQQFHQCVLDGFCRMLDEPYPLLASSYWSRQPVSGATWFQAQEYCFYIGGRLPTEAELWAVSSLSTINDYLNNLNTDFEWVNDWFSEDSLPQISSINPSGPENGKERVYIGMENTQYSSNSSQWYRASLDPETGRADLGFRCVLVLDTETESSSSVGRPCVIAPWGQPPSGQTATLTPYPCAPVEMSASCDHDQWPPVNSLLIKQSTCLSGTLDSITTNGLPLVCTQSKTTNGINEYSCSNPNLPSGSTIEVSYCDPLILRPVTKTCPFGYQLDDQSGLCYAVKIELPEPPCPTDFVETSPSHCIPRSEDPSNDCSIGFYSTNFSGQQVCAPFITFPLSSNGLDVENGSCLMGTTFVQDKTCCLDQDQQVILCPSGYFYYADQKICLKNEVYPYRCSAQTITLPFCSIAIQVTQTPTAESAIEPELEATQDVCRRQWNPTTLGWDYICD